MKKNFIKNICVYIVSKKRIVELSRLLISLNRSAKYSNISGVKIYLGVEKGDYPNLKLFKNLVIKKLFFEKQTSPIKIKNFLYDNFFHEIKVFLDDDIEVNKFFFEKIYKFSLFRSNCFLKIRAVNFFSKKIETNYKRAFNIESTGFVDLGKKKFKPLFALPFVAEDTELNNRIIKNNYLIMEDISLEIIHHTSALHRDSNRLIINGIQNTIEILRSYGAVNNFYLLNKILYSSLICFLIYKKTFYLVFIRKFFFSNLKINFFYNKSLSTPPYYNYFYSESFYKCLLFTKKISRLTNVDDCVILRITTFEKYQKIENYFNKIEYLGPLSDKYIISKNITFSKNNITQSTFENLNNFYKNKKNIGRNLIICVDRNDYINKTIFFKLNYFNFFKNIKKIGKIFIYDEKYFYLINNKKLEFYYYIFNVIIFPLKLITVVLTFFIIFPIKLKEKEI